MYIAHPSHGAGARPNRTQLKTAARKKTLNAGQCVHQPGEGRGRNRQAPPQEKKRRGEGEKARKQPTAAKPPANTTRGSQTPPPEGTEDRTPKEAQGDHPLKAGNTEPGTAANREKRHRNKQKKKKRATSPAQKKRDGGTGTTRPGTGEKKTKAQKTHPDNPAKKGWAQPRPGPSTHTHTARQNRKRRRASRAPTKPHTSHKQADTKPQPRTPQTAGTRGTTPQTVPKHTHPRPQPGMAGLTKPTPNRQPDPNTNAAQQ